MSGVLETGEASRVSMALHFRTTRNPTKAMTLARRLAATGAAALLTASPAFLPTPSQAASGLTCRASVSNATPQQYSNVYITVHTASAALVRTTAHYKTTNTTHQAKAGPKGFATIKYYISGATPGLRVGVDVNVFKDGHSGYCYTSFVPHR